MKANCVMCGAEYDKRGPSQVCGKECRSHRERDRSRRWKAENREKINARHRRWKAENRKKLRRYYEATYQRRIENNRRWNEANKEKVMEYKRRWYERNREKSLAYKRRWYLSQRDNQFEQQRVRRRTNRAAACLGIPPLIYAAMTVLAHHPFPESTHDDARPHV